MHYFEVIEALFNQSRLVEETAVEEVEISQDKTRLVNLIYRGKESDLWMFLERDRSEINRHCRKLSVVSSHHAAISEKNSYYPDDIEHFYLCSNLTKSQYSPKKEVIWLTYSDPCFYPTMEGAEKILRIHARLQEYLKVATPLTIDNTDTVKT